MAISLSKVCSKASHSEIREDEKLAPNIADLMSFAGIAIK
jgi:hypothetical protein